MMNRLPHLNPHALFFFFFTTSRKYWYTYAWNNGVIILTDRCFMSQRRLTYAELTQGFDVNGVIGIVAVPVQTTAFHISFLGNIIVLIETITGIKFLEFTADCPR